MAEVKKYRVTTHKMEISRPQAYSFVKTWLKKNNIPFNEEYGYSGPKMRYELTLCQVAELISFLEEYEALGLTDLEIN